MTEKVSPLRVQELVTAGMKPIRTYHLEHRGTVYEMTVVNTEQHRYFMFASNLELHNGDWLDLPSTSSIAWHYLTEKCPGLARFAGDKEGWMMLMLSAGVRVF